VKGGIAAGSDRTGGSPCFFLDALRPWMGGAAQQQHNSTEAHDMGGYLASENFIMVFYLRLRDFLIRFLSGLPGSALLDAHKDDRRATGRPAHVDGACRCNEQAGRCCVASSGGRLSASTCWWKLSTPVGLTYLTPATLQARLEICSDAVFSYLF